MSPWQRSTSPVADGARSLNAKCQLSEEGTGHARTASTRAAADNPVLDRSAPADGTRCTAYAPARLPRTASADLTSGRW